jgi:hypothetical protein
LVLPVVIARLDQGILFLGKKFDGAGVGIARLLVLAVVEIAVRQQAIVISVFGNDRQPLLELDDGFVVVGRVLPEIDQGAAHELVAAHGEKPQDRRHGQQQGAPESTIEHVRLPIMLSFLVVDGRNYCTAKSG